MATFKSQLATDAEGMVDSSVFGESIIYTFATGATRTVNAILERTPPQVDPNRGRPTAVDTMEVWVPADAVSGVSVVTERFDQVTAMAELDDLTTTTFRVIEVVTQDEGMWHLKVQK